MLLVMLFVLRFALPVSAETGTHLYDQADLLSDAEEGRLSEKLSEVSRQYDAQIVITTIPSADGDSVDVILEHTYDSMGFGYADALNVEVYHTGLSFFCYLNKL